MKQLNLVKAPEVSAGIEFMFSRETLSDPKLFNEDWKTSTLGVWWYETHKLYLLFFSLSNQPVQHLCATSRLQFQD